MFVFKTCYKTVLSEGILNCMCVFVRGGGGAKIDLWGTQQHRWPQEQQRCVKSGDGNEWAWREVSLSCWKKLGRSLPEKILKINTWNAFCIYALKANVQTQANSMSNALWIAILIFTLIKQSFVLQTVYEFLQVVCNFSRNKTLMYPIN